MVTALPSYSVRHLSIAPGLVLSPMSGVTCTAFRRLVKECNPGAVGLVVSEFVSVEGMTRGSRRTVEMMKFHESERPYGVQIFGYDVERMRDAARMVEDFGADLVDINCGCPAPKVVKRGGGCELMRQPDHLREIFRAVRKAVSIPLTMKMRSGWDDASRNALEIGRMAVEEGVEAIAVHGRTRAQLYRGEADWSFVELLASELPVPILGSGDVVDRESAFARAAKGAAGLFIGRGAISNPLVFSEILSGDSGLLRRDESRCLEIVSRYVELLEETATPRAAIGKVKQLVSQMARGYAWRKPMLVAMTLEAQKSVLRDALGGRYREHPSDCASRQSTGEWRDATPTSGVAVER